LTKLFEFIDLFVYKNEILFLQTDLECQLDQVILIAGTYVSESDILGPIDYLSDNENLVSFERAMFEDYSFKHEMKIFLIFMSISPLQIAN